MKILRFPKSSILIFLFLFSSLFLTSCSSFGTYNPATGRKEFIAISTQEEVAMGQSVHQSLAKKYIFSYETEQWRRLVRIGQQLALVSDREDYAYRFFLIEEDQLNAFTTPGGNIYVYTGLVDRLTSDDQIASVLAHEIGHCAARHTVKKFQAALGYDLITRIIFSQIGDGAQQVAGLSSNVLMNLVFSAYGRQDEYEADRLGVKYMHLAQFDLNAAVETLEILEEESKGQEALLITRSHPYLRDRIRAVKREIELVQTPINNNRHAPY